MNRSLLGSWCFVFLLKRSGALAEEGLNLQAPSLCVVFGSQDRGLRAVSGLAEAVLSPGDPYGCDEDMPLPPLPQPPAFPESQEFWGRSRDTSWRVHGVPTQSMPVRKGWSVGAAAGEQALALCRCQLGPFPALATDWDWCSATGAWDIGRGLSQAPVLSRQEALI